MEWCAKLPAPDLGLGDSCLKSLSPDPRRCQMGAGVCACDGVQSFQLQSGDPDLGASAGLCELGARVDYTLHGSAAPLRESAENRGFASHTGRRDA